MQSTSSGAPRRLKRYNGKKTHYSSVRLARAIVCTLASFSDEPADWQAFLGMSKGQRKKAQHWGVAAFSAAIRTRDAIRRDRSVPSYSLADLACLMCLAPQVD